MSANDDLYVTYYVVCVIDVLGQKQRLSGWSEIPEGNEPPPEFLKALRGTVIVVDKFRKWFEEYFNKVAACTMPEQYARLPEEQKTRYNRLKKVELKTQQFGDTFVFYTPTVTPEGDFSVLGIYRILGACCMAMITSLATKVPLRGAICIGTGTELAEETFYGPALSKAHHLEREVAGCPRIVVSRNIPGALEGQKTYSSDPQANQVLQVIAHTANSLTCEDTDGRQIVDFLGKGARDLIGDKAIQHGDVWKEEISRVWNFARSEMERFRAAGDEKHANRYDQLLAYIEPRLPAWGLSPERSP